MQQLFTRIQHLTEVEPCISKEQLSKIYNSRLSDHASQNGGAIMGIKQSIININNCTFTGNYADRGTVIIIGDSVILNVMNSSFANYTYHHPQGVIFVMKNCSFNIISSSFIAYNTSKMSSLLGTIDISEHSKLSVIDRVFNASKFTNTVVIYALNKVQANFTKCTFTEMVLL